MGCRLLPLALLVAAGRVDAWTSQYHDPKNTGMAENQSGPQDAGLCTVGMLDGFEIGPVLFQATGVLSSDGKDLYFGGTDNQLYSLQNDATTQNRFPVPMPQTADPAAVAEAPTTTFVNGQELVIVVSDAGTVAAFYPHAIEGGAEGPNWFVTMPDPVTSAPTVSSDCETVYVTMGSRSDDKGGAIYALHAKDGKTKWKAEARDPDKGTEHTARMKVALALVTDSSGDNHEFPVVVFGGVVALLNPTNGSVISHHSADNAVFASPASVFRRESKNSNLVYVRSAEDNIWFYEIADGDIADLTLKYKQYCQYANSAQKMGACSLQGVPPLVLNANPLPHRRAPVSVNTKSGNIVFALAGGDPSRVGVVKANAVDGTVVWHKDQGNQVNLNKTFNAVALDSVGYAYVPFPSGHFTESGDPVKNAFLVVFDTQGGIATQISLEGNDGAQPGDVVIGRDKHDTDVLYISNRAILYQKRGSIPCPSSHPLLACTGNGECPCGSGTCQCEACFTGADCADQKDCSGHGFCEPDGVEGDGIDHCNCDLCYVGDSCEVRNDCTGNGYCTSTNGSCICDTCFSGENCEIQVDCAGHGFCRTESSHDGAAGTCDCDTCYSGEHCEAHNTCSGHGFCSMVGGICECNKCYSGEDCSVYDEDCDGGGIGGGAVAAIVLSSLAVVGLGGFALFRVYRGTGPAWLSVPSSAPASGGLTAAGGGAQGYGTTASPGHSGQGSLQAAYSDL